MPYASSCRPEHGQSYEQLRQLQQFRRLRPRVESEAKMRSDRVDRLRVTSCYHYCINRSRFCSASSYSIRCRWRAQEQGQETAAVLERVQECGSVHAQGPNIWLQSHCWLIPARSTVSKRVGRTARNNRITQEEQ